MIKLYGSLAKKFQEKYDYDPKNIEIKVHSVEEFMKAMEANFTGFKDLIKKSGFYRVTRGKSFREGKDVEEKEVEMTFKETEWRMLPLAAGAGGKSGLMTAIAGVVLIAVGAVLTYVGYGSFGVPIMKIGLALAIGGVAQMLSPQPGTGDYSNREVDKKPSYLFNGAVNTSQPGVTIPVVYGESHIGSSFISGGLTVTDF
jgi:predicted phage tail protein